MLVAGTLLRTWLAEHVAVLSLHCRVEGVPMGLQHEDGLDFEFQIYQVSLLVTNPWIHHH